MKASKILADIELAMMSALSKFDYMTEPERGAFRLGFLAGAQYGLDVARKEMREIGSPHEWPGDARMKRSMLEKIVSILPRVYLDNLSDLESPWHYTRKDVELRVIAQDSEELREDILNYLKSRLWERGWPMFLDKLQFRKLENGFTVRYHVTETSNPVNPPPGAGFSKEMYCTDRDSVSKAVAMLITKYIDEHEWPAPANRQPTETSNLPAA
jgi:hypothetical protein